MTTQVAHHTATAIAPKPQISTGGALAALVPQSLDDAFRLAKALSQSGDMIPKHYQGNAEMTMAAIIRGMEVGLAPMQALSSIAVINGRATIWGDALTALMQRAGHHIDVDVSGDGDTMVATATLTRGDTGKTIVRTFSASDAKVANLWGKQGPWQTHKKRMLGNKARNFAIRDGAADALMGMQVAEDVQDYGPDAARDVTPKHAPRRGSMTYVQPETDEIFEASTATEINSATATDPEIEAQIRREIAERDAALEGGA